MSDRPYFVNGTGFSIEVAGKEYTVTQATGLAAGDIVAWGIADTGQDPAHVARELLRNHGNPSKNKTPWPKELVIKIRDKAVCQKDY